VCLRSYQRISDPEPLPPQRPRLSLLGRRYHLGGGLLDGRRCGCLPQIFKPCRLGVVLHRPIVWMAHLTSQKGLEGKYCELPMYGVLRSSHP
jgi:hypothetical protein